MRLYLTITWQYFLFYLHLPADRFMSIVSKIIRVATVLTLWNAINGAISKDLFSYFLLVSFLDDIVSPELDSSREIEDAILSGTLNSVLIKPVNAAFYMLAEKFGKIMFYVLTTGLPSLIIAYLSIKPDLGRLLLFFFYCILAIVISQSISVMVASACFFGPMGEHIRRVLAMSIWLSSGLMIPFSYFSNSAVRILNLIPFRHMITTPVEIFSNKPVDLSLHLIYPILWTLALVYCARKCWKFGLKHYQAIGI